MERNMYSRAIKMALKVEFLASSEELFLYAGALYSVMMWGEKIDEKNKGIQENDISIK